MQRSKRYNFRYVAQREKFFEDIRKDRAEIRADLGDEIESALRIVFDIGDHTSVDRKKSQNTGGFRGVRTFRDLRRLRRFLNSSREGGSGISWGRKDLSKHNITARLCYYTMRGNRVTGEKVLRRYVIENSER
jgi:hypothetical protein